MKRSITLIIAICLLAVSVDAQKIKEKDVLGTWKLVIDIEEEMDKEAEEADNMLEEVIIKAVSGFVGGIMEDIDIYFEFRSNNKVKVTVNAYDETDSGTGTWFINKRGNLVIEDIEGEDDDQLNISTDNDEWTMQDGILISSDDVDDKERNVYMTRVD
ncbi:MAG: hypothetical protein HRT61_03070 [Ekhidna sp.]|nr:hypothetical protein [Ekhidna sp.]